MVETRKPTYKLMGKLVFLSGVFFNAEVAKAPEDSMRLAVLGMVSSQGLVGWQVGSKNDR